MIQASPQHRNEPRDLGGGTERGFWMRSLRFAGLHRVLHLISQHPEGIRARDLNREIVAHALYRTERGTPKKSTLYHCRNTLFRLGAIRCSRRGVFVASDHPAVRALLQGPPPTGDVLSEKARESFGTLVINNQDCHRHFFRLFLPGTRALSPEQFRTCAQPVVWRALPPTKTGRRVELRSASTQDSIALASPIEVQSILYGVRYWAWEELQLIDEFFETGRGSVMYPVRLRGPAVGAATVLERLLALPREPGDWTTVSVNDLLRQLGEGDGYRVATVFDGIRTLALQHRGYVVLIPTIPNMAAMSATSRNREALELGGYFKDSHGRIISHVRFHNSL